MNSFNVHTPAGILTISATCEETARLDIDERGLGPILQIKPNEGPHEY